jgi:hypothetical protein
VHEYDGLKLGQQKIRLSRDALDMKPVAEAHGMQGAPEGEFRLRVLSADSSHHPGPGLTVDNVGHLPPGLCL